MLQPPVPDLRTYYADHVVEDDRLHSTAHGRLEFERTQELLRRYLPSPPARVLDVGGATGAHARRLAENGYEVHVQIDDVTEPLVREIIDTGRHDPRLGFTTAYLHRVDELADEMRAAGLHEVDVLGVEGPMGSVLRALDPETAAARLPAALRTARMLDGTPELVAASSHLLGVARA